MASVRITARTTGSLPASPFRSSSAGRGSAPCWPATPTTSARSQDSQLGELFKAGRGRSSPTPGTRRSAASRTAPSSTGWRRRSSSSSPSATAAGRAATGSVEHVRFFVDFGSGWVDAGVAATRVYDVAAYRNDCAGDLDHPYVHVVGVVLTPLRKFCASPVLPRVRAILSWQHEPTAGDPGYVPGLGRGPGGSHPDPAPPAVLPGRHPRRDRAAGAARSGDDRATSSTSTCCRSRSPSRTRSARSRSTRSRCRPDPDPDPVPFSVERLSRIYSPDKLKVLAGRAVDPARSPSSRSRRCRRTGWRRAR